VEPTSDAVTAGVVALPIPASSGWMAGGLADVFYPAAEELILPASQPSRANHQMVSLTCT